LIKAITNSRKSTTTNSSNQNEVQKIQDLISDLTRDLEVSTSKVEFQHEF
jgi:hypothetical protein